MVLVSKTEIIVPDDVGKDKKKISDWGPITPYMEKCMERCVGDYFGSVCTEEVEC